MTDVSDNSLYAIPIDPSLNSITGNARSRVIGVALHDAPKTQNVNILTNGYCTVRAVSNNDASNSIVNLVRLNSTTDGNTYVTDVSGIRFTDSNITTWSSSYQGQPFGGTTGYADNESYSIIFDAQVGNTIDLSINNIFLEGASGTWVYDRLGFQVSDDGSTWVNADISGMLRTDSQLTPPWPPGGYTSIVNTATTGDISSGWIFPWEAGGFYGDGLEETRRDASGNPTAPYNSQNGLFFSATSNYNGTPRPTPLTQDKMKRFIKFFFESDGSTTYGGWDIKVISSGSQINSFRTNPANANLYVSMSTKGKSTSRASSNIKIGHSLMDPSSNALNDILTVARINLKSD